MSAKDIQLLGAGASFPVELYEAWSSAFENYRSRFISINLRYVGLGSMEGKRRLLGENGTGLAYAASELALTAVEKQAHPTVRMFPTAAG